GGQVLAVSLAWQWSTNSQVSSLWMIAAIPSICSTEKVEKIEKIMGNSIVGALPCGCPLHSRGTPLWMPASQESPLLRGHPQGSAPTFTHKDGDPALFTVQPLRTPSVYIT